jgi:hypothetical protein
MKTSFNPRFVPSRTFMHDLVGRVDEYHISLKDWKRLRRTNLRGIQAFFIPNNAKPHQRNHFALKVYPTLVEAIAAWQRQSIAARKHLAPPVRRICKFVVADDRTYWGYQTCVASHVNRVQGGCSMFDGFDHTKLARDLSKLNIAGTVNDGDGWGYCSVKRAGRLSRRDKFGGDLHGGNIGFYKHRLVCIDFGTDSIDFFG